MRTSIPDADPITFTEEERRELATSVTSMYMSLQKDKNVSKETLDLWWGMFEKLRKASNDV